MKGVNGGERYQTLLVESLGHPEVSSVAILDVNKKGFLRVEISLINADGRAARHATGVALLYVDNMTDSRPSPSLKRNGGVLSRWPTTKLTIRLNFCTNPPRRGFTFRGQNGELECNLLNSTYSLRLASGTSNNLSFNANSGDKYEHQLSHFVDCIDSIDIPKCTIDDGIKVIELINEIPAQNCL